MITRGEGYLGARLYPRNSWLQAKPAPCLAATGSVPERAGSRRGCRSRWAPPAGRYWGAHTGPHLQRKTLCLKSVGNRPATSKRQAHDPETHIVL